MAMTKTNQNRLFDDSFEEQAYEAHCLENRAPYQKRRGVSGGSKAGYAAACAASAKHLAAS